MSRYLTLSIANPCKEKWDGFSKTKKGGYCESCKKEVIDFTSWNEEEIKAYFKFSGGSTCGRFKQKQLTTYFVEPQTSSNHFKWLPVSIVGASLLLGSANALAQQRKYPVEKIAHDKKESGPNSLDPGTPREITGTVRAVSDKAPLPGINVVIKGTAIGTVTDVEGRYSLVLPARSTGSITIIFSFIGFADQEISFSNNYVDVFMEEDTTALDELVITGGCTTHWWTPRRTWWRIKRIFTRY
jgi:hypothetical protein